MTEHDLKVLMDYIREEDMCVYEEGRCYECMDCTICRAVFEEKLRKDNNLQGIL